VIIWNNQASGVTNTASASILNLNSSSPTISYSLIANSGGSGTNIDADPKFVQDGNPGTLTDGDYRLQLDSPAIDAGDNDGVTTATDLAGSPRIRNGTVDMGAYEAAPEIKVLGNELSISDGVTTTNSADGTDFGPVLVGQTMTHTFTISNTGSFTLSVSLPLALSNSTHFALATSPATIIPPESTSSFQVTFTPSTTGTLTSTLEIGSDDTDENPFSFVVGGTGIAPEISVQGLGVSIASGDTTPRTLDDTDFGDVVALSDTIRHTFTISNTGSYTLTLNGTPKVSLSTAGTFTVTNQPSSPIGIGSASTFEVEFAPSTTGVQTTTVSINSDDSNESTYTFDLQGTGIAPEINVLGLGISIANGDTTPNALDDTDFGSLLVNSSMTHTFTISNTGSSPLNLSLPITLSDSTHITITNQPAATIAASSGSTFSVQFAPTATGFHTTTISIANEDHNENRYTFVVGGLGTVPPPPNNQGPVLHQAIPDITVDEGAAGQLINLLDYFSDPENDPLFFRIIANSKRDVVPNLLLGQQLGINNPLLALQFGTPGQTTITIQAVEFATGRTFHDDFIVTVQALPTSVTLASLSAQGKSATWQIGGLVALLVACGWCVLERKERVR